MKKILWIGLFFLTLNVFAAQSMRRCMLLPINDTIGGSVGFQVFENLERYLKDSDWCYYESNSEILNILSGYRNSLDEALANEDVLRILSEKAQSGSLIKVKVNFVAKGSEVSVSVIGANGRDVYFMEKTSVDSKDPVLLAQTVKNWLEVYEKNIPYDGIVTGVLGNQFTTDIGRLYGLFQNAEIEIRRIKRKRKHPLLKEVVDWETVKIGEGKIFHTADTQSQGKINAYDSKKRVRMNDWVIIKEKSIADNNKMFEVKKDDDFSFGKLGNAGVYFNIGSGSVTYSEGSTTNKMSGLLLGVNLKAELWATRKYWGGLEIGRKFGSYSKDEGDLQSDSNSISFGHYKIKAGYKYLPLGFFYGPQIDGYLGYASYSYGLDNQTNDGIGEVEFSGLFLGARGSIPLMKLYRLYLSLDFMLGPSYQEEVTINGSDDSSSNFNLEFGGSYQYSPNMLIETSVTHTNSKAKFKGPERTLKLKDTSLKIGTSFNF